MTTSIIFLIIFIILTIANTALLFDMLAKNNYRNVDKKAVVWSIVGILTTAACVVVWASSWKNEALKAYDEGKIKKVVIYNVKSIDGNEIKKDSTYTYRVVK
jgi:uncharacterized membrane protein